ncbi:hypothetical protein [Paenibacillus sp. PK1-4R]|uniref:hypothetical protein n=1 Tax=Paenibacillus sp. PK1-4R TaxID=3049075 RepID=UPI0025A01F64|nr:hypothetical protein [Paenibacillus sp. PK1-4R]WJM05906.1 hypothetical protein QNO02_16630 [Paenibacillus sp. PK1-4R]
MKSRLLDYYTNKVRARVLIYQNMSFLFWSYMITCILTVPISITLLILLSTENWALITIPSATVFFVFFVYIHKQFNNKARTILNREFSVKTEKGKWIDGFHEVQVHLITEYLIEHNLYSRWKIERLMDSYKTDNSKDKMPPLIAPSILIAVLAPNLNYILKYIYEMNIYQSTEEQFVIFFGVLTISIFIVTAITYSKKLFEEFTEIIVYKKVGQRNNLISILDDILITIES